MLVIITNISKTIQHIRKTNQGDIYVKEKKDNQVSINFIKPGSL